MIIKNYKVDLKTEFIVTPEGSKILSVVKQSSGTIILSVLQDLTRKEGVLNINFYREGEAVLGNSLYVGTIEYYPLYHLFVGGWR